MSEENLFEEFTLLDGSIDDPFNSTPAPSVQLPSAATGREASAPAQAYTMPQANASAPATMPAQTPGTAAQPTAPVQPVTATPAANQPQAAAPSAPIYPQAAPTTPVPAQGQTAPFPAQPAVAGSPNGVPYPSVFPAATPPQNASETANPLAAAVASAQEQQNVKTLFDTPPLFVYQSVEEDILDPSLTFEDLRLQKMDHFPALENGKEVSWTIMYGQITQRVTEPKIQTIYKLKQEIEMKNEFLAMLKKSKDKAPRCKIKPVVMHQSKGIASYMGVYGNEAEAQASRKPIVFFPSEDGKMFERRETPLGVFTTPARQIPDATSVSAGFVPALPLIPNTLLRQILAFFRHYAMLETPLEVLVNIYWDVQKKRFLAVVPHQQVTGARIEADIGRDGLAFLDDTRFLHYADIHSHNVMHAFFSEKDNADEQETRVYLVVGRLHEPVPEIKARICCGGTHWEIPYESVFETEPKGFPAHWSHSVFPLTESRCKKHEL